MASNPTFIRAMFKVGDMMAEDLGLDRATGQLIKPKGTLEEEKAKLMAHDGYLDKTHPEHNALVAKVTALNEQLHGKVPVPTSTSLF